MDTSFSDTDVTLSNALRRTIAAIKGDTITLHQLFELIGEQGLLICCCILTIPFLLPVSIPGVSTVFGLAIIFIGISVTLNRPLWLPARLLHHQLASAQLIPVMERGIQFFGKLERWMRIRLRQLTDGAFMNRLNGVALTAGGVLLIFPLSFIPFSNTLPALSILLLALGLLQRDGFFIVAGYFVLLLTVLYFVGLALLVVLGGQSLFFS
ncbi:MAG: exopolysaccharide biosynthesis protein [Caldilineaceae bacterium]|nr:exopolysaccharide biosynthesis protein [Caldilineaceae bacterium]